MRLKLERLELYAWTIGALSIDGEFVCWTLEDQVRAGPKIAGKTAIPPGVYQIDITPSARFKRLMPILLDVPGFSGVRIHSGNTVEDTDGCILVGLDRYSSSLGRSRKAYDLLFAKLREAKARGDKISIEIE